MTCYWPILLHYALAGRLLSKDYTAGTAASSPTYNYVYASYIDEPVMRSTGSSGAKHFFHCNQQYSITALTDASGAIVERYAYTAYGTPTITDASGATRATTAVGNRYTYTGREWDETLALYHYRARMYDSVGGRFVSRDPIGFVGSQYSLYAYVSGMSLSAVDPSGLETTALPPTTSPVPRPPTVNPGRLPPGIGGTGPIEFPRPSIPSTKPVIPGLPRGPRMGQMIIIEICYHVFHEAGQRCTRPVCTKALYWVFDSEQQPVGDPGNYDAPFCGRYSCLGGSYEIERQFYGGSAPDFVTDTIETPDGEEEITCEKVEGYHGECLGW